MRHTLFGILMLGFALIFTMFLATGLQQLGQSHHVQPVTEAIALVGP